MEKILDIIELIACENGLEPSIVSQVVKDTIIKIAKKQFGENLNYIVEEDAKNRTFRLIHLVVVCADDDERAKSEPQNFITLSEAQKTSDDVAVNDEIHYEISLENMSRNAVNMLFSDLEFHIQRTIENQLFTTLKAMTGKLVSGQVVAIDERENTYVEMQDIRAILPLKNRIKGEKFKVNDTINCILKHVRFQKDGIYVELSRTTPRMLEALLEQEVPEIKDGEVIIQKSARIPGDRAKVALYSTNPRIDPIGSSVGTKGVRINAVSRELNGENIDCIEYSEIPEVFIAKALSPAQITAVKILSNTDEEKKAQVSIMSDQKSKAIGRSGVNIRLACMLTGFDIELAEIVKESSAESKGVDSGVIGGAGLGISGASGAGFGVGGAGLGADVAKAGGLESASLESASLDSSGLDSSESNSSELDSGKSNSSVASAKSASADDLNATSSGAKNDSSASKADASNSTSTESTPKVGIDALELLFKE
ncbi:hypothetical protein BKN38_03195 [Helicobacter sp. CLO-3]|uniref:transcription termination factor NusA n=1 Tax=unclassified Helicobacter TaxID=2593540 RepID=UPI000805AE34|nr:MULTISPECIES: transcription termination factor NusA [unclassified Helicobacter]OBV29295.1 transcription termination factor NusA [Helicobacter sp. CLO-3]OHU84468.1 hypothetical protein BKN38_03195 [Helicobacter sp. CLO-3]